MNSIASRALSLIIAAGCAVGLSTRAAEAQRWVRIGTTTSGNPVFTDQRSIATVKGITSATIRIVYRSVVKMPAGDVRSSVANAMFDCAKHVSATKESRMYGDENGRKLVQRTVNKIPGYTSPIVGSPAQLALKFVCEPRK